MKKILFASLILVISCSTEKKSEECNSEECLTQQAYDKVIAVHDDVMPKLGKISDLKELLEAEIKTSQDSVTIDQYINLMQDLDAADESMWIWMRSFNSDIEELPFDSVMNYLQSEKNKVDEVAKRINSSIAAAEEKLN